MKKIIFILILISISIPVLILAGEITKKLEWGVKEFLIPPPISETFSKISKKGVARPSTSDRQRSVQGAATPKEASTEKLKDAKGSEEKPAPNWCQSDRILIEGGAAVADDGVSMTICGTLPSSRLLLTTAGTGALSFSVLWQRETTVSPQFARTSFGPVSCSAGGVRTVRATAYGSSNEILASGGPWECSERIDTIYNVPPGSDIRLVVVGENASGNAVYRGEQSGITIAAGQANNIGTIKTSLFQPALETPMEAEILTTGQVAFAWAGVSGMSSYRIQISKDARFTSPIVDADTTSASFNVNSALESRTYFWRVKGMDVFNHGSEWSPARSVTVDTLPLFNVSAKFIIDNGIISTNSATLSLHISAMKGSGVDIEAYYFSEDPERPAAKASGWATISPTLSYSSVIPYTVSAGDGPKTIYVWFKDAAGRVSKPAQDTIIFDTTPPHTTITGQPANPTNAAAAVFSFASSEDGSTFRCSLDDGAYTPCVSPATYTGLAAGPHTFDVKATDAAGNAEPAPVRYSWTRDVTPPLTAISEQPAGATNKTSADFTFTSTKPGSTYECQLDDGVYAACTSPHTYTGLTPGSHNFTVKATDAAGNSDPLPPHYVWTIDTTPPRTAITALPANLTNSISADFSFISTKAGSTFECQLDDNVPAVCTSPHPYGTLAPGAHTFTVRATDALGNVDPNPVRYIWVIDTTPPDTTITAQPADQTNTTVADFSFNSTKDRSTFQCSIDGGIYKACSSPQSYTSLAEGHHTFDVKATDAAGNTDPNPARFAWTIDLTPPHTVITIQPLNATNSTTANFSFASSKLGSTFECQLDGGDYTVCSSPQSYADLAAGSHTFSVKATDAVGNADPAPASWAWEIDITPPHTAITNQPANPSSAMAAGFNFTSSKAGSVFECQLDDRAFTLCSSPFLYTNLSSGPHTFTVKATDAVGNVDPTPASYTWVAVMPPKNETPTGFINKGGAYYVHHNTVKLSLAATDADVNGVIRAYYISESPVMPSASDTGWVPIPKTKEFYNDVEFTLSEGGGKKTVYVWFKDADGNISEVKSDSIYFFNANNLIAAFLILQLALLL